MQNGFIPLTGPQPPFREWLLERYGTSPLQELDMFRQTSLRPRKDYEAAMEWFRRRYRQEMEQRQIYREACPFLDENDKTATK